MKTLIVYYSRSNITRKVAEYIQSQLNADIEEIIPKTNYNGKIGYMRGAKDGATAKIVELNKIKYNPSEYDLIIIGGPVWASKIANPIISYIKENTNQWPDLKFFATAKSSGFEGAFKQLEEACGKTPLKTLSILEKEVKEGKYETKINEFILV